MKTTLYIIRHAQAEGNLYRRCQGWYDSLITETGYRQIQALEKRFQGVKIDAVYSSDLFRTRTTAGAIYLPRGLELQTRRALREINMGDWEDRPWADLDYREGEELRRFNATDPTWCAPNGESCPQAGERLRRSLFRIAGEHPGETVAVVSHGTAIRCLLASLREVPVEQWCAEGHSDNTAVSLVEIEGDKARVVFANDNSHLPPEISTFARQTWWKREAGIDYDSLRYAPLDLARDGRRYLEIHREAWQSVYGSLEGYDGEAFYQTALFRSRQDPRAVTGAYLGNDLAGVLQLDPDREAEKGVGYLSFLCMLPQYRRHGLGVQLLGEAVSFYRPLGRTYLRLSCAEKNQAAQRFYRRSSFYPVERREGIGGGLDVLEKYIGFDRPPRREGGPC